MFRVVIDTNIFFSAFLGGKPKKTVIRALRNDTLLISPALRSEILRVPAMISDKLGVLLFNEAGAYIEELLQHFQMVNVRRRIVLCRDPADDLLLCLAASGNADFIVTGDKDLLSLTSEELLRHGVRAKIIRPAEYLEIPHVS